MKKIVTLALMLVACIQAWAESWTDDNGITWEFTVDGAEASIQGCDKPQGNLEIPSTVYLNDVVVSVTTISQWAFSDKTALTSVFIPEGVTKIGRVAFLNCSGLKEVVLPYTLSSMGDMVFSGCTSLEKMYSLNTSPLTIYEENTFNGCTGATLYVPNGCKSAYSQAKGWGLFSQINEMPENSWVDSGCNLWTFTSPSVYNAPVTITGGNQTQGVLNIPAKVYYHNMAHRVNAIGEDAFHGKTQLTAINIPEGVTSIGEQAFYLCENATTAIIPQSVTSIDISAFAECSKLEVADLPAGLTTLAEKAFYNCESLKKVTIPVGVRAIRHDTFYGCGALTEVTLHDDLQIIENQAFYGCKSLERITIPSSVKTVGESAFLGCQSLTEAIISEGVETFGNSVFYGCKNLSTVSIPSTLETISYETFSHCEGLTSVTIPEGVKTIEKEAFRSCKGMTEVFFPVSLTSIGEKAFQDCVKLGTVTIPEGVVTIEGNAFADCKGLTNIIFHHGVTTLGESSFYGCTSLKSLTLPASIETIGESAFYGCSALTAAIIPEGVKHINGYAFYACSALTNIILPAGLESIGSHAFFTCWNLESITINEGVQTIGTFAFHDCPKLTKVYNFMKTPAQIDKFTFNNSDTKTLYVLPGYVEAYESAPFWQDFGSIVEMSQTWTDGNGITWTYSYDGASATITKCDKPEGHLVIPSTVYLSEMPLGVTAIADNAFKSKDGLLSVIIPEGVTSIGHNAFQSCGDLKDVVLPSTLTSIAPDAFTGYSTMVNVISYMQAPVRVTGENTFSNRDKATLYVPAGTKSAYEASNRWNEFQYIKEFSLDDHWLDNEATLFMYSHLNGLDVELTECSRREGEIVIPKNIVKGNSVVVVTALADHVFDVAEKHCAGITSVTVPESVTSIGSGAFFHCDQLVSVNIPAQVTEIKNMTFSYCTSLTSIDLPKGVTKIGSSAFSKCSSLKNIHIPEGVTSIGNNAFGDCSALKSVNLPENLATAGDKVFMNCTSLKSIMLPKGVTEIGDHMFDGCSSLASVIIPSSVTKIGHWAFYNCENLASVTIPESVASIGSEAFNGCSNLTVVNCSIRDIVSINSLTFSNRANATLYVYEDVVEDYRSAQYWQDFDIRTVKHASWTAADGNVWQYITGHIFGSDQTVAYIVGCSLPEGDVTVPAQVADGTNTYDVVGIYDYAFTNNRDLATVTIPEGVQVIGEMAFRGCTSLTKVTMPSTLTYLQRGAFQYCWDIASIDLPSGLSLIGDKAFYGCDNLTTVNSYVSSPVEIDAYTFTNRNNATLYVPMGSKDGYQVAEYWKQFLRIVEMSDITEVQLTVGAAGVATFASDYPLDFSGITGVKAYIANAFNPRTGKLVLTRVDYVPAGTGLYIKGQQGTYDIPIQSTTNYVINLLVAVTKPTTVAPETDEYTNFILANGDHGVGFYTLSQEGTIAAGKAYLQLPTMQVENMVGPVALVFDDEEATGIEEMEAQTPDLDSQSTTTEWYTLDGQLLNGQPTQKGVYIVNGRKVVVK